MVALRQTAPYNAGMFAALRKNGVALLLIASHAIVLAIIAYFDIRWSKLVGSRAGRSVAGAAVLIGGGADAGLLGLWAALGSNRTIVKWVATAACVVCWWCVYDPDAIWIVRNWSSFGDYAMQYHIYTHYVGVAALAALTIAASAAALGVVKRRGAEFRMLSADELQRERGQGQFQISHLLLLTAVLSLVLAFSVNGRPWLSRPVSLRWNFPAYAPFYSAEAVMFSGFSLATITLVSAWAALGFGRPWLRLAMALAAACFIGFAWAFAFTSPRHQDRLLWNVAYSAGVALLQAAMMSAALVIVRNRGYRFAPAAEQPRPSSDETASL
jgi:hypothetical protein